MKEINVKTRSGSIVSKKAVKNENGLYQSRSGKTVYCADFESTMTMGKMIFKAVRK